MKCGWCKTSDVELASDGMLKTHKRVIPGGKRTCTGPDEGIIYNTNVDSFADSDD